MTNPVLSLLSGVTRQTKDAFLQKTQQVEAVQAQFLRSLLQVQQDTVLGRALQLADIRTVDQYRERVPILPYSSYEPYIERVAQGEPGVMTADPVLYLNLTSGSTGKQKLVPVTAKTRQITSQVNRIGMGFAIEALRQRNLFPGKMLLTSSIQLLGHTTAGIPYGPVSVGHLRTRSFLERQLLAHPFTALEIADSLARHYVCLLFALRQSRLGGLGANFPILALRICDYLESYAEDLIQDLETGAIADWLKLEPHLRQSLQQRLRPHRKRAAYLRQVLKQVGRLTPQHAWEQISFITTARGGTSDFYFERFPQYFGNTPIYGGIYSSAEATFGIYPDFNVDGSILAMEAGFFEFIPEDQWATDQPKTLLATEVTPGQRYRILVTNYSGLYRYDIGDVVEVVGFHNQAPILVFRHRLGGLLSSTTEKTTEFHAIQVMQRLQQDFGIVLENFCITLSDDGIPAHYLVNIELAPGQHLADPHAFIRQFDRCLQEIHVSYAVKRRDQVPPPRLRLLAPGSFHRLRDRLLQRGIPEGGLKFPHITENRRHLDGLTVLQEVGLEETIPC
ncbi:MAG TPA: GH3 auxin-responsive promoter family protein [Synechococcales cyanobacterium M55_K2018_004]|nr:GH3 auxin-responsive promoter family protein [Synechococcales cyanobacterium M55_K2018_004]